MRTEDRVAILVIAEMLAQHLEAGENPKDNGVLASDSVRGAMHTLSNPPDESLREDIPADVVEGMAKAITHELGYHAINQNNPVPHWFCTCGQWRLPRDPLTRAPHRETATEHHKRHVQESSG